jgi:saccharopine dehydrogenase-like NADP-dependent oxidoreductase
MALDAIEAFTFDATDGKSLKAHIGKHKPVAVISGLPYYCNVAVAEVARSEKLHYFDLTEDVEVTRRRRNRFRAAMWSCAGIYQYRRE